MINWQSQASLLKDETANGAIWREIAMIEAQRKTAEQLHLIAQTLSTILEMTVESVVEDPSATIEVIDPKVVRGIVRNAAIREALGEMTLKGEA